MKKTHHQVRVTLGLVGMLVMIFRNTDYSVVDFRWLDECAAFSLATFDSQVDL